MPRQNVSLLAFNRGLISPLALARTDLKRTALSAEVMENWVPRMLGSMMLRPGLQYLGSSASDAQARHVPFVFSIGDTAIIELTNVAMRVWIDDVVLTRGSVSSAVANGTFNTDLASWTDADESGGTSAWVTGGYMGLTGNGTAAAIRRQQVTVAAGDINDEHALRIVIQRGPVTLRVGSTSGGDEYITETDLETGHHSLAFTPTGASFYVQFSSRLERLVLVDSCAVEGAGAVSLTSPWPTAALGLITHDQSGDIVFLACAGYQQRKIERRAARSWSIVTYQSDDGPFRTENVGPITITPSGLNGNITLTASAALFRSTHVGALWSVSSTGQRVEKTVTAQNTFSDTIRITGVDSMRVFTIIISGLTATGSTVTLQRSLDEPGTWEDVPTKTWTADTLETFDDGLDNQIVYYRIGVKTGGYVAGTILLTLGTPGGSTTGITRITAFTSSTVVSAEVLKGLGDIIATDVWAEGAWSSFRGYPSAVTFDNGRLWWMGKNNVWGSASDAYYSYTNTAEGDAAPISRTIGAGPVDTIRWALSLQRIILGAEGAEQSVKSSSFEEPITPTNFQIRAASTIGSAPVQAVKVDDRGLFVRRGGTRVMQLAVNPEGSDYAATDITVLVPEIGSPKITRMAVQRQPDTRLHCVRSDGTAAIAVTDPAENTLCWLEIATDGAIEDVVVLPGEDGDLEDAVYYHVHRTINGVSKRYLERWATEAQCAGGTVNRQADSFLVYSGLPRTTITGLTHLESESVVVWGNGKDLGTHTVTSGQITGLSEPVTDACVGLTYRALWKGSKLAYASGLGTALLQPKRVSHLGVMLLNSHYQGLKYGPSFSVLYDLPQVENGTTTAVDTVYSVYDEQAFEFSGEWDTDSRLCLQATAPRPCTILAAVLSVETHDRD